MSNTNKTARIPHDKLAKWFRIHLETVEAAEGSDRFINLKDIADEFGATIDTAEDVLRGMSGVAVVPAAQVRKSQPDFPLVPRKGEGKGHLPGVKLETASETRARETRERMTERAQSALQAAVAHLGLRVKPNLELEPMQGPDGGGPADVLSAIILSQEAT